MIKQFRDTYYYVSDEGKIYSHKYAYIYGNIKELKPYLSPKGYQKIKIYFNNKTNKIFSIHRIVAELYLNNYSEDLQVNHIDGNKQNNNIDNLEMVTCKENVHHYQKIKNGDNWEKLNGLKLKEHIKLYNKEYYIKNIEKERERSKQYYLKNKKIKNGNE